MQQVVTSSNWKKYIWKPTQKRCQMVILGLSLENYNIDSLNHSSIDISFLFSQAYYVKVFVDKVIENLHEINGLMGDFLKKYIIYCNTIGHLFIAISLC